MLPVDVSASWMLILQRAEHQAAEGGVLPTPQATSSVSGEPVLPTTGATTSSTAPRTPLAGPRRSMAHHRSHSAENLHMPLVSHTDTASGTP